jgi:hypothetical protein
MRNMTRMQVYFRLGFPVASRPLWFTLEAEYPRNAARGLRFLRVGWHLTQWPKTSFGAEAPKTATCPLSTLPNRPRY